MADEADINNLGEAARNNVRGLQGWSSALGTATQGVGQFAGALVSGSTSLQDYTKSFSTLSRVLPIPGMQTLGRGLEGAAKVLDEMNTGYQGLSRAGFSLRGSLTGTALAASDAGMSVQELGKFAEANAQQLRALGGTGSRATAMFAGMSRDFANSSENYVKGLAAIGFSNEEINETLVDYATINRAQFLQNIRAGNSQNNAAMKFAVELDRLSALTGESRKELAKKMEADRRQGRVQAFLASLNSEQQKAFQSGLRLAEQNGPLAKKAYEDMMMQASLTGESANAAAIYGSEYINNLANARNQLFAIRPGDTASQEQFTNGMLTIQSQAMDSLRTAGNLQLGVLRSTTGIINDIQNELAGSIDLNDSIELVRAQMQNARNGQTVTREEARLHAARMTDIELQQAGLTRGADGNVRVAGSADVATDAMSSFQSTTRTASAALREELITTLVGPTGVGSQLRQFATGLDEARVNVTTDIQQFGTTFREEAARIREQYNPGPITTDQSGQAAMAAAVAAGNAHAADQTGNANTVRIPPGETVPTASPNMFGGMLNNLQPGIVGERGPEFIIPKGANNLIATAQQMARQIAPQMQQMAEQMKPQMEQMAAQFEPQLKAMANNMQSNSPNMNQQLEVMMGQLTGKFDQLLSAYRDNTREIRRSGGNVYRT